MMRRVPSFTHGASATRLRTPHVPAEHARLPRNRAAQSYAFRPAVADRVTDAPIAAAPSRHTYVAVFRGLLIAHMALDHASLFFQRGPGREERAAGPAPQFADLFQFLTRFTGVPDAPGFFMAGFMVAATSHARSASRRRS